MGEPCEIKLYLDKVKYVMIQRKHSLGYVEFIRGKYSVDDYHQIIRLFQQMQQHEIDRIGEWEFERLWADLWKDTSTLKIFRSDFEVSRNKFNLLKFPPLEDPPPGLAGGGGGTVGQSSGSGSVPLGTKHVPLSFYARTIEPINRREEWGFPKGRRNYYESNLGCAIREFVEETGIDHEQFVVLDHIQPLVEQFVGTNGIPYKHVYDVALMNPQSRSIGDLADRSGIRNFDTLEIGDIGLFPFVDATNLIREYHVAKKNVLNDIFRFVVSLTLHAENKEKNQSGRFTVCGCASANGTNLTRYDIEL